MRIHHLSCGTMCPWGGALMYGWRRDPSLRRLVCHCLLIETDRHGLVLVDTGIGLRDVRKPRPRLGWFFLLLNGIRLQDEQTALHQIEQLGFRATDVRHIVLTHLDFDHAGGIEDFPEAVVHLLGAELQAASQGRRGFIARQRYRPLQWDKHVRWRNYGAGGEPWFGFDCVRDLDGLPPEILLVPLIGHTWGHSGVVIRLPDRWLLHAGDAYFHVEEMNPAAPSCPPGLRAYQRMMEVDRRARLHNQHRLRGLARAQPEPVEVFCSHDPLEYIRLRNRAWYDTDTQPPADIRPPRYPGAEESPYAAGQAAL
ncbi:MBL fold metallo-hydrolase [Rhodospirillaceae bacterium SYSU D60014]|uniref:MBL fold metallo-hydrolase n=1 Tax=Virgifigura deserti TaxID=2268457 RepID=UPI000E6715ED